MISIFTRIVLVQNRLRRFFLAYGVQIIDLWKRVENDRNFLKFPLFYCDIKILHHGFKKKILKTASNLVLSLSSLMDLKTLLKTVSNVIPYLQIYIHISMYLYYRYVPPYKIDYAVFSLTDGVQAA